MIGADVRVVDPHDEPTLHRWWQICHAAQAERPIDFFTPWEAARVALPRANPEWDVTLLAAYDGDRMVGAGLHNLPVHHNQHAAFIDCFVAGPDRRQGHGGRLLAEIEARVRALGRTTVIVDAHHPPARESAGTRFGAAHGYAVAHTEQVKATDLARSEALWDALATRVEERRGDHRVVTWRTHTPEEHRAAYAALLNRSMTLIPGGDLDLQELTYTPDRLRAEEQRRDEIGRDTFVAAAVAPDGSLVGCSDVYVDRARPALARIGITLVLPGHRGRSLGLAMKLATHRALRAAYPECAMVQTSNAGTNAHMNAVNDRLGYRVVEETQELQKRLVA